MVESELEPGANEIFPPLMLTKLDAPPEYTGAQDDKDALQNATSFRHNLTQVNNKIIIDPYIKFDTENAKFRNQKLKLRVYIPEGKIIKWDKRTEEYINLKKVYINWDNVKYPVPPVPPVPPLPPGTNQNRKIEIKTSKSGDTAPSKIVINIDSDNEDLNAALDKAQEKLDKARENLEDAETIDIEELNDDAFEARIHRQHYIFRMVNGELVPID